MAKGRKSRHAAVKSEKVEETPAPLEEEEPEEEDVIEEEDDDLLAAVDGEEEEAASADAPGGRQLRKERWFRDRTENVIYIKGLPHGLYEEELRAFLSQFGPVKRVRTPRSRRTGRVRGYAFVQFYHRKTARQVTMDLHGSFVQGKVLHVEMKEPGTVKPHWPSDRALIALDERISKCGLPTQRMRLPPCQDAARLLSRKISKESARNKRLAELGVKITPGFWTDPVERSARTEGVKEELVDAWRKRKDAKMAERLRKEQAKLRRRPRGALRKLDGGKKAAEKSDTDAKEGMVDTRKADGKPRAKRQRDAPAADPIPLD
jgi:nucleolar protein 15